MTRTTILAAAALGWLVALALPAARARADGDLGKLQHVVIVMQENHSFDNYFGALPYVPGGPYHGPRERGNGRPDAKGRRSRPPAGTGPPIQGVPEASRLVGRQARGGGGGRACDPRDHSCVDGLRCRVDAAGSFDCANTNLDDDGSTVHAFHEQKFCTGPDLDHSWSGSHFEANFRFPALTFLFSPNDGFVLQNDRSDQPDVLPETPTDDDTMGFYTQEDLPFYYALAQRFAIDDRYFCSVIGPTFPNRAYELAATSFGHLTTSEILPPSGGYKPITGSFTKLLDQYGVSWVDYFSDLPTAFIFGFPSSDHLGSIEDFQAAAAAGTLPQVSFVDPNFGILEGAAAENDEHPPTNIRKGQKFVSDVVNAVRNGPNWKDSIVFVVYDEHGGFYDHVAPAPAPQGGARNPDGIAPGQCADLSNPPASTLPGGGKNCTVSQAEALAVCPGFTATGPYPFLCPNFDQLGFRVPFIAVSPFSKPHYVSHTVGDHTSMLALIEKRFLRTSADKHRRSHPALTARDAHANTLEDMFDFAHAPSLDTPIPTAPEPSETDPGCPFVAPDGSSGGGGGTF